MIGFLVNEYQSAKFSMFFWGSLMYVFSFLIWLKILLCWFYFHVFLSQFDFDYFFLLIINFVIFALCANNFAQFWFLSELCKSFCAILIFAQIAKIILRKYVQNLLRVMQNNAEYCAQVRKKKCLHEIAQKKLPFLECPKAKLV